jgi:hypothetical protein
MYFIAEVDVADHLSDIGVPSPCDLWMSPPGSRRILMAVGMHMPSPTHRENEAPCERTG